MAIYPGAIVKLLTVDKGRQKLTEYNRVNAHVAVSESSSLYGQFNQKGAADSHFYVRKDGTVEQYVDTAWRANADYEGNDATISIESQGGVNDPNGEKWTSAQVETIAQIYAWAVKTHGIARALADSAKKDSSSRGLSWHRLGIDGNFPALPDIRAGREQRGGGMHWSTAFGKACPGDAKVQQMPSVYDRAIEILDGSAPPNPDPDPTALIQGDDMFTVANNVSGSANEGTWWIVVPQGDGKPRATVLGSQDNLTGVPHVQFKWSKSWEKFQGSVTFA